MDLRRLRYFVAVAETLHFGKAAARLRISQPPLSRQIQQLEQEIGALLLRRTKRHVELTDAGAHLLVDARRLLNDAELVGERTVARRRGRADSSRWVSSSAVDYSILPGVLRAYREAYPGVTLDLRELTSDVQLRDLQASRIDAGMLLAPAEDSSLAILPLLHEPLVAAIPSTDPQARRGRHISLGALAMRPFILFPRSECAGIARHYRRLLSLGRVHAARCPGGDSVADDRQPRVRRPRGRARTRVIDGSAAVRCRVSSVARAIAANDRGAGVAARQPQHVPGEFRRRRARPCTRDRDHASSHNVIDRRHAGPSAIRSGRVQVGPLAVRWYGLMYLLGFVAFVVLGKYRARQNLLTGWHPRDVDDMLFYGVFGVILGGRLGYVLFYKFGYYAAHPLEVLALWQAA